MTENSSFFSEAPRTFREISKLHPLFILLNLNAHTPTVWTLLFEQSQPNSLITDGQRLFQRLLIHFLLPAMFSPQCSVSFPKPGRCLQKSEALPGGPHHGLGMVIARHSLTGAHHGLQNTSLNSLSWESWDLLPHFPSTFPYKSFRWFFCILRVSKKDGYRFCMEPGYSYKGRQAFGNRSPGVVGKRNGWMTEEKSNFLFSFCQCRIPPGKALCSQEWYVWIVLIWDQLLPME